MKMHYLSGNVCMVLAGIFEGCTPQVGGGGGEAVAPVPTEAAKLEGEPGSPAAKALFLVDGVSAESDDIEDGFILTRVDAYLAEDATVAQINASLEELVRVFGTASAPSPLLEGTSYSAPQVAGLASYLWLLSADLRNTQPPSITRRAIFENTIGPEQLIDAYAAVLCLDAAQAPTASSAPVRQAILDVNEDGEFNVQDVEVFQQRFVNEFTGQEDHSRYDLNGDGITGGPTTARFDLDRIGSTQYGAADYSTITQTVGGAEFAFDESSLTDVQILCYHTRSPLFQGDSEDAAELLGEPCAANTTTELGELEIRPDTCLANDGVANVRSSIRASGTDTPLETRTHAGAASEVYIVDINVGAYTARFEGLNSSGMVVGAAEKGFTFAPDSHEVWEPACEVFDIEACFGQYTGEMSGDLNGMILGCMAEGGSSSVYATSFAFQCQSDAPSTVVGVSVLVRSQGYNDLTGIDGDYNLPSCISISDGTFRPTINTGVGGFLKLSGTMDISSCTLTGTWIWTGADKNANPFSLSGTWFMCPCGSNCSEWSE